MAATYEVISMFDRAIDWGAMSIEQAKAYWESRDLSLLDEFRIEARVPVVYVMRECPNDLWDDYVDLGVDTAQKQIRALRACLTGARNLPSADEVRMGDMFTFARSKDDILLKKAEQRLARLHRADLREVAYQKSFFQDTIEHVLQGSHTLHELWDATAPRRAAASRSLQAQSSGGALPALLEGSAEPSKPITPGQPPSESDSDKSTDATAAVPSTKAA